MLLERYLLIFTPSIYPHTPKMNAHIERFNRTLEEEFIMWRKHLMVDRDNLEKVNEKLQEYVHYYNTVRPHPSLGFVSLRSII